MLFEPGFFGTRAALFMDMVTIYFFLLPFLVIYSIRYAVKGRYKAHYISQVAILVLTMGMVVIFEVGVRITGGFFEFVKASPVNYDFMVGFLLLHIAVAVVTVVAWLVLVARSLRAYKKEGIKSQFFKTHRTFARYVFVGISLTSIMGCMVYGFLFL